jgi:hypothetical protein
LSLASCANTAALPVTALIRHNFHKDSDEAWWCPGGRTKQNADVTCPFSVPVHAIQLRAIAYSHIERLFAEVNITLFSGMALLCSRPRVAPHIAQFSSTSLRRYIAHNSISLPDKAYYSESRLQMSDCMDRGDRARRLLLNSKERGAFGGDIQQLTLIQQ